MTDEITAEELQTEWAEQDQFEVEEMYRAMLESPRGRKFLFYLLGLTKFMQNPFTSNALTTSFNCGEASVGQRIMADITQVDPIGWAKMQQEVNDVNRTRQARLAELNT